MQWLYVIPFVLLGIAGVLLDIARLRLEAETEKPLWLLVREIEDDTEPLLRVEPRWEIEVTTFSDAEDVFLDATGNLRRAPYSREIPKSD